MFGKWFSKAEENVRTLEHPRDLQVGDMLQMLDSFALPTQLKGQTLTVIAINSYQYEDSESVEFVLQGVDRQSLFLSIDEEDGECWASFSQKIQRGDVEALFTLEQFAAIFDTDDLVTIERQAQIDTFERWVADRYTQTEQPYIGYYYQQDCRRQPLSQYQDEAGAQFEFFELQGPQAAFALEIEVWEGGETDVALSIIRPCSDIVELFPGKTDG